MTRCEISMLLLMAGSSMVWGSDTKENLNQARTEYRQAVAAHGEKSPEAREARRKLRQNRRTFHETRRERQHAR
jgi:hypothetical protein